MSNLSLSPVQAGLQQRVTNNGDGTYTPQVNLGAGGGSPAAGTYTDRSVTTVATTSTQLMAANTSRKDFLIMAPLTADVWVNLAGGTAGISLAGCIRIPAGYVLSPTGFVPTNAITYYCATDSLVLAALEG